MSAFLSFVSPEGVSLLTDACTYDDAGIVRKIASKVWTCNRVPLAVTTRGHAPAGEFVAQALCELADDIGVDAFLENLQHVAGNLAPAAKRLCGANVLQVLVVAFQHGPGGIHRAFATDVALQNFNKPAFEVYEPPAVFATGSPVTTQQLVNSGVPYRLHSEPMPSYIRRVGADIMEYMRRVPGTRHGVANEDQFFGIGGRCEFTLVSADGVSTETLRVWKDKVGKTVRPFVGDAATRTTGPNRAERRRIAAVR